MHFSKLFTFSSENTRGSTMRLFRKLSKRLLITTLLVCTAGPAIGADFHVDSMPGANDSAKITAAINLAEVSSATTKRVVFSGRTYDITEPITLDGASHDDLHFAGAGSSQTTIQPVGTDPEAVAAIFVLSGVRHCEIYDLKIDGNVQNFDFTGKSAQTGIFLLGVEFCTIKNIEIRNLGKSVTPGGAHIVMAAIENDINDPVVDQTVGNFVPSSLNSFRHGHGRGQSCRANTIQDCTFEDHNLQLFNSATDTPEPLANFAIRVITNWKSALYPPPGAPQHAMLSALVRDNTISGCDFNGGFYWNALELAGHGTIYNEVVNNDACGCIQTAIEADKAASFNTFAGNVIKDTQARDPLVQSARGKPVGTWVFAMRMQGFESFILDDTVVPLKVYDERSAVGNEFINNTIDGVIGNTRATGAILLSRTVDAVVADNTIPSLPKWKPYATFTDAAGDLQEYTSPEDPAAGIKLKFWVENTRVANNTMPRSKRPAGSRFSSFVQIMEFPEDLAGTVRISDLPTGGIQLTGATTQIPIIINEYLEQRPANSLLTWSLPTDPTGSTSGIGSP